MPKKAATARQPVATEAPAVITISVAELPRIGEALAGGLFAGIVRGVTDGPDYALVLLPDEPKDQLTWKKANEWAASVGGALPSREEGYVLWANARDHVKNKDWHWLATQYAGGSGSAWIQAFTSGGQGTGHKGNRLCARAVRRLVLQSFGHSPADAAVKAL